MQSSIRQPDSIVEEFLSAQNAGEIDTCLEMLASDAIFDVGRGRYDGKEQIRTFLTMLVERGSNTRIVEARTDGDRVHALWAQADDDGRQLGIDSVKLQVEVTIRQGKIAALHARPTPDSLAVLRAAADGRTDLTVEARRALGKPQD